MPIEFTFLDYLQVLRTPLLDKFMLLVTALAGKGELALAFGVALLCFRRSRKIGIAVIVSLIIAYVLGSAVLKNLIARVRPCNVNMAMELLVKRPHSFSCPSGHTALAFAAAMTLYFVHWRKAFFVALPVACVIAFSRMYLYVHFPTDILAGICVGTLSAYVAWKVVGKFIKTFV